MHGLINRSIQRFLRDSYGEAVWSDVVLAADLPFPEFEAMLNYDDEVTWRVLEEAAERLHKPQTALLEDIGTYLVSHANNEGLRRLLRFAGVCFEDFLHSIDDLPDRTRLAVSDLELPVLELHQHSTVRFSLICRSGRCGFGHVMVGVLRAMADDYGALVMLEYAGCADGIETIEISLVESAFSEGRSFDLGARAE